MIYTKFETVPQKPIRSVNFPIFRALVENGAILLTIHQLSTIRVVDGWWMGGGQLVDRWWTAL